MSQELKNSPPDKGEYRVAGRGLVPQLRFPEFQDAPEWEEKKLLEVCDINPSNEGLPESFVYIDLESVVAGKLIYNKKIYRDDAPSRAQRLLENGDVIYQIVRPYQRNNFFCDFDDENNYVASTGYAQLRSFDVSRFLYQLIHTDTFVNKVIAKCTGSSYPAINSSDLAEITVAIPKAPEQQKIADCLTSLDELIAAQSQKLDALKFHKKGLLQQLFPVEGETLPSLRFPEFQDAPEWEESKFSKYIVLYRGSSPRPIQEYLTKSDNGVNWIKIGDTKATDNYIINQVEERITPKGAEKSRKVNRGELILANSMSFGKTYQLAIYGYIYDGWFVLREYEKYFHKQFLLQLLNSEYMQNQYVKLSAGGIVQNISSNIVYNTILPHTSFSEQRKIAECLTSLDEMIAAQSQKLDALKVHKKGLMQQLFPSPDESEEA